LQLKQNQFNFTFQQPLASTSANTGVGAYQAKPPNDTNMTGVRPTSSPSSSSNIQSPINDLPMTRMISNGSSSGNITTTNANKANASTPQLTSDSASPSELNLLETLGLGPSPDMNFTQTSALAGLTPPSGTSYTMMDNAFFGNSPSAGSGGGLNDLGFSSSFGDLSSSFAPMPYQTIAANNMFTSFRDPSENPNAWASFGPNPLQSQSLKNTYDELFGAGTSLSGNDDINISSFGMGSDDLMPFSFLPDLSNGTGGSQFGGLSPISHVPTPPSATSTAGPQTAFPTTPTSQQQDHDMVTSSSSPDAIPSGNETGKTCPKSREEFSAVIQQAGTGTFGPSANPGLTNGVADAEACAKMTAADATKLNLDIGTAWRAVRQHPQFEVRLN
jgi:hypothetical protein